MKTKYIKQEERVNRRKKKREKKKEMKTHEESK